MKRSRRDLRAVLDRQLAWDWHPSTAVSTTEAAELLGISHDIVLRLVHKGKLEFRRNSHVKRSRLRIYVASIERLSEQWRTTCNAPCPTRPAQDDPAQPPL